MCATEKSEIAKKLVEHIDQLPPMPSNVFKLRQAAANPNINYDHITPILKEDPSICADLLHIANSARYGVGHKVETIEEAVRYFGMGSLVEFVAAACSEKIIRRKFASVRNLNEYLIHSRKISIATSYISRALKVSSHDQEVYSITGLLHDIGRLVIILAANEKKYSKELLGVSWEVIQNYISSENQLYGMDHAEIGMLICRKWEFPDRIIEGVKRHHTPLKNNKLSFDGLVIFLSEIISIKGLSENIIKNALPQDIFDEVKLTPEALLEARDAFEREVP
jgi:putative nucleotidyltransferase with HDIG domain